MTLNGHAEIADLRFRICRNLSRVVFFGLEDDRGLANRQAPLLVNVPHIFANARHGNFEEALLLRSLE